MRLSPSRFFNGEKTMKVKFVNRFIVPGFGRKRFPGGRAVVEVPDSMKDMLPSEAEVLPDTYVEPSIAEAEANELHAADAARSAAESGSLVEAMAEIDRLNKKLAEKKTLDDAGLGGFSDNRDNNPEDDKDEVVKRVRRTPAKDKGKTK